MIIINIKAVFIIVFAIDIFLITPNIIILIVALRFKILALILILEMLAFALKSFPLFKYMLYIYFIFEKIKAIIKFINFFWQWGQYNDLSLYLKAKFANIKNQY